MHYYSLYKGDGITDSDRFNNALTGNKITIHDLSFLELLLCSSLYGNHLKYFNTENKINGTWADVFCSDELTVIAKIYLFDSEDLVDLMKSRIINDTSKENYIRTINYLFYLISTIDSWYFDLCNISSKSANLFGKCINDLIAGTFLNQYKLLLSLTRSLAYNQSSVRLPKLFAAWKDVKYNEVNSFNGINMNSALKNIIYLINTLLMSIKKNSVVFYSESLKHNEHTPETGLFITFLDLFKIIQDSLNTIPQKYIDFYYKNILQFPLRPYLPCSTFVTVKPVDQCNNDIQVKAGTQFSVEFDDHKHTYVSNNDTAVKNVQIVALYSLLFRKSEYKEPERTFGYYSGIRITDYSNHLNSRPDICFPLFGLPEESGCFGESWNVQTGFAIASRILFLSEGERTVTFHFCIRDDFVEKWITDFKDKIQMYYQTSDEKRWLREFKKIMESLFKIELTTTSGWFTINQYYIDTSSITNPKCKDNPLTIEFYIPIHIEPVSGYNKEIHGNGFDTILPVCKFSFGDNASIYPYSILKGLSLHDIQIEVSVKKATNISIYNKYGPLDTGTPFMPFGPIPNKGDDFIIGNSEIINKRTDTVDLEIEWGNLPYHENGFRGYYNGYSYPFENNCFQAEITELCSGEWVSTIKGSKRVERLFNTEKTDMREYDTGIGRVLLFKHIRNIKLNTFREKPFLVTENDYKYSAKSKNGFFKLTLTNPQYGFGHTLYANDTAKSFLKKFKNDCDALIPSPPYIPVINKIRLNYHAYTRMDFSSYSRPGPDIKTIDSFYHLYPLGLDQLYPVKEKTDISLIPEIDKADSDRSLQGNLFIGLKGNGITGNLSLFFKMDGTTFTITNDKVFWYYLVSDTWIKMDPRNILYDSTNGLLTSGVLTISIPDIVNNDNETMPKGMYWLRASVTNDMENYGNIHTIQVNGLQIYQLDNNETDSVIQHLPDNTTAEMLHTCSAIDSVKFMGESFRGVPSENKTEYITRISERLCHKQRAVTINDYEKLILQRFPQIYKVKCFPNMISGDISRFHPGRVLVSVVGNPKNNERTYSQCPKINLLILREINNYLRSVSSAFAAIEVINAVFEEILVRCKVVLKNTKSIGIALNNLDEAVSEYVSPWSDKGNRSCFGWKIRLSDLQYYILENPYVKQVTEFSVLHKSTTGTKKYQLGDSAEEIGKSSSDNIIQSSVPWSVSVPFKKHKISLSDEFVSKRPEITGINDMEIGTIFILKGKNYHGNAK